MTYANIGSTSRYSRYNWSSISVSYRSRSSALIAGLDPLLLDLRRFSDPVAQVVELRPADVAAGRDLDVGDDGRVQGEGALHADPEADLADRERLADPAAFAADHDALEDLDPLPVAFHDPDVDLDRVAGGEWGPVVAEMRAVNEIGGVHGAAPGGGPAIVPGPPSPVSSRAARSSGLRSSGRSRSGRRCRVRRWASRWRHRAISAWSPERRTAGTSQPRYSAGRVYWGSSRRPPVNDSWAFEASLPSTPGTSRVTASTTTSAAASPPART